MDSLQSIEDAFNMQLNKLLDYNAPAQLLEALNLLHRLLDNIAQNPTEQKFRTIKTSNARLKSTIFSQKYIEGVLISAGFQFDAINEAWVLPDYNVSNIYYLAEELKMMIELLCSMLESPEAYQKQLEYDTKQREVKLARREQQQQQETQKGNDKIERITQDKFSKSSVSMIQSERQHGGKSKTIQQLTAEEESKKRSNQAAASLLGMGAFLMGRKRG